MHRMDRRRLMQVGAAAGVGALLGRMADPAGAQAQRLAVLGLSRPDPMPPSPGTFGSDLLAAWQADRDTTVDTDLRLFPEIRPRTEQALIDRTAVYDVLYNWATVPEFASALLPLERRLPADLLADLPRSQANPVSWQGGQFGILFTSSLMLLYYSRSLFETLGVDQPPRDWDDVKRIAALGGTATPMGLVMPYGAPAGIGGVTSLWMALLQQAGGRMYDDDGRPVFGDAPGIDALQLMIDLMPYTTTSSLDLVGSTDAAFRMVHGEAAMTFTFPSFWGVLNGGAPPGAGAFVAAPMPNGPESNATVTGVDAWTIAAATIDADLATQLVTFYLSGEVQRRQVLETGWLPARLSVLADPQVQAAHPLAAPMLQQAQSPFDSFITPNYLAITDRIGRELQRALAGEQTARQALTAANAAIQPLLTWISQGQD